MFVISNLYGKLDTLSEFISTLNRHGKRLFHESELRVTYDLINPLKTRVAERKLRHYCRSQTLLRDTLCGLASLIRVETHTCEMSVSTSCRTSPVLFKYTYILQLIRSNVPTRGVGCFSDGCFNSVFNMDSVTLVD